MSDQGEGGCPACHGDRIVPGHLVARDLVQFQPDGLRFLKAITASGVTLSMSGLRVTAQACVACGHVWTHTDPETLRRLIRDSGTDETARRVAGAEESGAPGG